MENRKIFAVGTLGFLVLTSAAFLLNDNDNEFQRSGIDGDSSETVMTTEDGTKYIVKPSKLVQGCPGMDCIPSIDDPSFESREEAEEWLEPEDRVIGVEIDDESRAYPLKILSKHEIVNDEISGEPIVVTYCPLCRSGVTYSRVVNGETLEFGVSGKLLDANLVMYDRGTESYWNQIQGKAIVGPRTTQKLDLKFSSITEWQKWKEGHPRTKVLSRDTGIYPASSYDRDPYAGYDQSDRVGFGVGDVDGRLPSKAIVFGIEAGGASKAYPEETVRGEKLIQDDVGEDPVVIFERPDDGTITAFIREDSDGETLELTLDEDGLRDSEGDLWSFKGEETNGSGELQRLNPQGFYWFAWSNFRPETEVYNSTN